MWLTVTVMIVTRTLISGEGRIIVAVFWVIWLVCFVLDVEL